MQTSAKIVIPSDDTIKKLGSKPEDLAIVPGRCGLCSGRCAGKSAARRQKRK